MQPFVIQCTTCKARLKVSDPSLVGDILACPKCDSMVQVTPPADWPASAVTSATDGAAAQMPTSSLSGISTTSSSLDSTDVLAFLQPPPIVSQPAAPNVYAVAITPGPGVLAKLIENWWMLACGIGIGVVLGLGGWMIATMAAQTDQAVIAAIASAQPASVQPEPVEHTAAKPVETPAADEHADESQTAKTTQPRIVEDAAAEEADPDQNVTAEAPQEGSNVEAPAESATADANAQDSSEPTEAVASAAQPVGERQGNSDAPQPSVINKLALNGAHEAPKIEAPPLKLMSHKQVKDRLSEKLPAIEFDNKVPLEHFTRFVAQLSGVQVEIDPDALAAIHKAGGAPVSVKLENASIAKVLQTAVSQHGLTCVLQDDKVLIRKK